MIGSLKTRITNVSGFSILESSDIGVDYRRNCYTTYYESCSKLGKVYKLR